MKLSLLPKLLLMLAVLFSAPGFAMSANHDACTPTSVTQMHHTDMPQSDTSQHGDISIKHCGDTAHCMLCFSVVPSVSLSLTAPEGHETYRIDTIHWLSLALQPEPYPPRNLHV